MLELIVSPEWFVYHNILFELILSLVLATCVFKTINFSRNATNKTRYYRLALGFAALSTAIFSEVILITGLFSKNLIATSQGVYIISNVHNLKLLILVALIILSKWLLLFGLYIIYAIRKNHGLSEHLLVGFLLLIILYFGNESYYVTHLIALVLSLLITTQYHILYKKRKHPVNKILTYSFTLFSAASFMFIIVELSEYFFVAGQLLLLLFAVTLALGLYKVHAHG